MDTAEKEDYTGHIRKSVNLIFVVHFTNRLTDLWPPYI